MTPPPSTDTLRFYLGQRVWFALDADEEGIVTGILFRPSGVLYKVTWPDKEEREHYESELTSVQAEAKKQL